MNKLSPQEGRAPQKTQWTVVLLYGFFGLMFLAKGMAAYHRHLAAEQWGMLVSLLLGCSFWLMALRGAILTKYPRLSFGLLICITGLTIAAIICYVLELTS